MNLLIFLSFFNMHIIKRPKQNVSLFYGQTMGEITSVHTIIMDYNFYFNVENLYHRFYHHVLISVLEWSFKIKFIISLNIC